MRSPLNMASRSGDPIWNGGRTEKKVRLVATQSHDIQSVVSGLHDNVVTCMKHESNSDIPITYLLWFM